MQRLVQPWLFGLSLLLTGAASQARAQQGEPTPEPAYAPSARLYAAAHTQWRKEMEAFDAADQQRPQPPGGIVFVGSSTIRMWTQLGEVFSTAPQLILNRGFGGSTMRDCSLFAQELVVRHRPRQVVIYAGDNDLAAGRTPLQVLADFARFANAVRAALPGTRISVVSVKPSPSRVTLLPQVRQLNNMLSAYLRTQANTDFIDVYPQMLGADGQPRAELFLPDRLHMNAAGYRIWQAAVAPHLLLGSAATAVAATPR